MYNRLAVNLILQTQAAQRLTGYQVAEREMAHARSDCYAAVMRRHHCRPWSNASICRLVDAVFNISDAAIRIDVGD